MTKQTYIIVGIVLITFVITAIVSIQYLRKNTYAQSSYTLSMASPANALSVGDTVTISVEVSGLDENAVPEVGIQFDRRKLEYVSLSPARIGAVKKGDLDSNNITQRMVITGTAGSTGDHELAQVTFRIIDTTGEIKTNGKGFVELCSLIDPSDYERQMEQSTSTPNATSGQQPLNTPGNFDKAGEDRLFQTMNASRQAAGNPDRDGNWRSHNLQPFSYDRSLHQAARKLAVALNASGTFERCLTDTADSQYTSNDPSNQYYWKNDPSPLWWRKSYDPYMYTDADGGTLQSRLSEFGYTGSAGSVRQAAICRTTNDSIILPKDYIRGTSYTDLAVAKIDNNQGYVMVILVGTTK